jgi:hypothetical protein
MLVGSRRKPELTADAMNRIEKHNTVGLLAWPFKEIFSAPIKQQPNQP